MSKRALVSFSTVLLFGAMTPELRAQCGQTAPGAHTVCLEQVEDPIAGTSCRAAPTPLVIQSGDTVTFSAADFTSADEAKIKKKKATKLKFDNGLPKAVPKSSRSSAGKVTGSPGDALDYEVVYKKGGWGGDVACRVDPVICIEGGSCDPPQPPPPLDPQDQEGEGATRR